MRFIAILLASAICIPLAACSNESDRQTAEALQAQARQRAREQARLEDKLKSPPPESEPTIANSKPNGIEESFRRLDEKIPGRQGVAIGIAEPGTGAFPFTAGSLTGGVAWSTAKLPVAMAAVKAGNGSDAQLRAAITASDNAAAEALWSGLGGGSRSANAATAELRASGDDSTTVQAERIRAGFTPFGQTQWSLSDQVRFAAGMNCTSQGRRVLELMSQVVPAQRWGLSAVGSDPHFKGGWGPGIEPGQAGPWMERQLGLVTVNGKEFAVAIASEGGNHDSGISALNQIAAWLTRELKTSEVTAASTC